jgi:hypothetical protein
VICVQLRHQADSTWAGRGGKGSSTGGKVETETRGRPVTPGVGGGGVAGAGGGGTVKSC